jgi:hypothetical protein
MVGIASSYAQIPEISKENVTYAVNISGLITQLASAIKTCSFTDSWAENKEGVMGKAQSASDPGGIASTISSLAGFIKPSLFKRGTTASSIASTAGKVTTMAQATGLLKAFEGGLKPEAFTSAWSRQRSGWLSALNLL